jgi:hypothetical protein
MIVKSLHQFFYYHSKYLHSMKCRELSMGPSICTIQCSFVDIQLLTQNAWEEERRFHAKPSSSTNRRTKTRFWVLSMSKPSPLPPPARSRSRSAAFGPWSDSDRVSLEGFRNFIERFRTPENTLYRFRVPCGVEGDIVVLCSGFSRCRVCVLANCRPLWRKLLSEARRAW